jgi:hypothetical protein
LFARVVDLSHEAGWEFGGPHAGHLVGEFRHEKIAGDAIESYIAPGQTTRCGALTAPGRSATGSSRFT